MRSSHCVVVASCTRKGFDTLIRASAQLRDEFPHLRVILGGDGRDRARLERLAKACAPVTFLGHVDDALQPQWIAACDLMVMDCRSRWLGLEQEGFGIVFIEAAACALDKSPDVRGEATTQCATERRESSLTIHAMWANLSERSPP